MGVGTPVLHVSSLKAREMVGVPTGPLLWVSRPATAVLDLVFSMMPSQKRSSLEISTFYQYHTKSYRVVGLGLIHDIGNCRYVTGEDDPQSPTVVPHALALVLSWRILP